MSMAWIVVGGAGLVIRADSVVNFDNAGDVDQDGRAQFQCCYGQSSPSGCAG